MSIHADTKRNEPRLKPEQTKEIVSNEQLVALIRARENEAENMLKLWQQNKGFIFKMAKRYSGYVEMDDLMQEGYLGLCEAVRHYDLENATPFINYAAFWIKQVMQRYIDNSGNVVRIPSGVNQLIRKYRRILSEYRKYYGKEPTDREMRAFLEVSEEKLEDIKKNARMGQIRSLSEPLGEEEDYTLADTVASSENLERDVVQELDRENMSRELWLVVDRLPGDLPAVMHLRYQNGMTLERVGQEIGVSRERVRNLEAKAFRMLRLPKRCKKLRAYHEEYLTAATIHHVGVRRFQETWTSEVEREVLGW